ncbi:MAG: hypothetical protein JWN32_4291, partial [Solirubrobacterales bacterium]|nr:hypothetical protein [Solirubrobacterales bacterium]
LRLLSYERAALSAGELFLGVLVAGGVAGALGGVFAQRGAVNPWRAQ